MYKFKGYIHILYDHLTNPVVFSKCLINFRCFLKLIKVVCQQLKSNIYKSQQVTHYVVKKVSTWSMYVPVGSPPLPHCQLNAEGGDHSCEEEEDTHLNDNDYKMIAKADVKLIVTYREGLTASVKLLVDDSLKELTERARHGT